MDMEKLQKKVVLSPVKPVALRRIQGGWFIDFGKDAFGTLELKLDAPKDRKIELRLGEALGPDGLLFVPKPRSPECSRRFRRLDLALKKGCRRYRVKFPVPYKGDDYQTAGYDCTSSHAVPCPRHIGEVMPFRYVELRGFRGDLTADDVTQLMAHYPFDDNAADFNCSDDRLNTVWDLCKHTIKSVTFLGSYIDGDRERMPYEGDSLVQQLSQFCLDTHFELSRGVLEWFCEVGTQWCYEFVLSVPVLAWRHYLYSGDRELLERHYRFFDLATLAMLKRTDGLLVTGQDCRDPELIGKLRPPTGFLRDVIDWPPNMRDNYEIGTANTVANSFHFAALQAMENIAAALNKKSDVRKYHRGAEQVRRSMLKRLVDPDTGLFVDSEGSRHSSLQAVVFPVAHGLVEPLSDSALASFLETKKMSCSVWAAQFLLDALFILGKSERAIALMNSKGRHSWLDMLRQGATMTMECWSNKEKPEQDWNHPWATAPANIITRRLMGIRPLVPGFDRALIAPGPGQLRRASIVAPTRHGAIKSDFEQSENEFRLQVEIPNRVTADVHLPRGVAGVMKEGRGRGERERIFRDLPPGNYSFVGVRIR